MVAGIAEELRQLPGVRIDLVTSPGSGYLRRRLKSLSRLGTLREMAVRHRDRDNFKAPRVPMHAQPSSDPVKRWRRSKRRPRFRRPPMTGHLWVDALVSVTFPRADVAPVGYCRGRQPTPRQVAKRVDATPTGPSTWLLCRLAVDRSQPAGVRIRLGLLPA